MKTWMKAACMGLLVVGASFSAVSAIDGIKGSSPGETKPVYNYVYSCDMSDAQYILRDYNGYVGVFSSAEDKNPVTVTDIEVDELREADRDMLGSGIAVSDRDELLTLLEDLGS